MRIGVLPVLLLAAAACSRSAPPEPARPKVPSDCGYPETRTRSCMITLSSALTDTLRCSVDPVYDGSNDEFLLRLSVESSDPARVGGPVSITVGFRGEPRASTYRSSQPGARSMMFAYSSTYLEEWSETAGGAAPQGSHTLTITKVGSPYCFSLSKAYPRMQGSLDATLPATKSTSASGTVALRATF